MTAGNGVRHSEYNASKTEKLHFFQIWILPEEKTGRLRLVASRDGKEGSLKLHQDASVYNSILEDGGEVPHNFEAGRHGWLQVARGSLEVNGETLSAGDAVSASDETVLKIRALENQTEFILFDLA